MIAGKLFGVLLDRAIRGSEFETVLVRGCKQPVRSGSTEHGLLPPEFFMEGKVCSISALCAAATTDCQVELTREYATLMPHGLRCGTPFEWRCPDPHRLRLHDACRMTPVV